MSGKFAFDAPDDAIRALADSLLTVSAESEAADCDHRVLADDILADRDSPAADVSAMDGYGVRISDLRRTDAIPVDGESTPGAAPPAMPDDAVVRIFTGAIVPDGCDAVIKRENTEELGDAIRLGDSAKIAKMGENIRRAGENASCGSAVLCSGTFITAAQRATMANFGALAANICKPVRVGVITTGDEVRLFEDGPPQPWQLRNSNQIAIGSLLSQHAWVEPHDPVHCKDDRTCLVDEISEQLQKSDAIILTGGVSMGDYDYVPDVVQQVGGRITFHGLPIRPGKPILGAATSDGKLILGLPGNPVSATVGCRRFAVPLLAKMSGQKDWLTARPIVKLKNPGTTTLPLHWMRLVRMLDDGLAEPVTSMGSGDLVSLGKSTGFVEVPKHASGEGPWPYQSW